MRRALLPAVVLSLVAACSGNGATSTTTTVPSSTTSTTTSTTAPIITTTTLVAVPVPEPPGLDLDLPEVPFVTGTWPGSRWPTSLTGVAFTDAVPDRLRSRLATDGFAIDGMRTWTQLTWLYSSLYPYGGRPVFVTTDAAYHHWHLMFDKVLRDVEAEQLLPVLERFAASMVDATRSQAAALTGTPAASAADGAAAFFEAVATLLELDVGPIGDRARAEVALALGHTDWAASPSLGGTCPDHLGSCVDYSLFTPRGHYTRSADLTRFFRAMSLLGNAGAGIDDPDALRTALLIARMVVSDEARATDWATLYHPTAFLVGTADDYTPFEAATAATAVASDWMAEPALLDDATLASVAVALVAERPVGIDPAMASVRTMGTRFVYDSWVFDGLTDPAVPERVRVSALDLAAVFGSDWAYDIQVDAGETAYDGYADAIERLRIHTAAMTVDDWGTTVYGAWLYALEPMWHGYGAAHPPFMRTDAWAAKSHQTGFGSWAELRHDTILYAKQAIAEGDMEPPPEVLHWVEPDPVAFRRIANAARLLRDGLVQMDLLPGDPDPDDWWTLGGAVERLIMVTDRLADIAATELRGEPITAEDNEFLGWIGGWFEGLLDASGDYGSFDEHAGIVADVFLDPTSDRVLEAGTGDFNRIFVIVPDGHGGFAVATGGVYAYYEFWQPRDSRLDDETWWRWIEDDTLPARPGWATDHLGL